LSKILNLMKKNRLLIIILLPLLYVSFLSPKPQESEKLQTDDSLKVLPTVLHYVKRYYATQSAIKPKTMLVAGVGRLEKTLDEVLVDFPDGENSSSFRVQVLRDEKTFDMTKVTNLETLTDTMEEVFQFVKPRLVSKDPSIQNVEYAVIDEMLETLDHHSGIITPQVYKEFMVETEGSFGGLGIVIGIRNGQLTVIAPIEGTPAYNLGIKPNDRIVQIEDESTVNMSLIEAVGKLRGPKGTSANIYIMREGFPEPKRFSIVRDTIKIESVETFNIGDRVGYVRIRDFQRNTLDSLKTSLRSLKKNDNNLRGIILDLRGNPGGLLDQAERISNLFLKNGVIVTTWTGDSKKPYRAIPDDFEFGGKIVILADFGSASASEILAGALKNNERAVLVGERTFGKGSVQQIFELNDGSALKLTIAHYLTPGDISIQDIGITPDIELDPVMVSTDKPFDTPSQDRLREQLDGQKRTNVESKESKEKPFYSIIYLETPKEIKKDGEETPEEALSREEKRKKIESDFSIKVAKDILSGSNSLLRKEILGQIQGEIKQISESEGKKIQERWQKTGIDWSVSDNASTTHGISVEITPSPAMAKSGEKLRIRAEVENTGAAPIYRLRAMTKSDNPVFDGKEFIFGKLAPGEKRQWNVTFEIPKGSITREDEISLNFEDAYKTTLPDFKFKVVTGGLARPVFAFNYEIVDDGRFGSSGNGNGIAEPGEIVGLLVRVKNTGGGSSEKSTLALKDLSGGSVFLKTGRSGLDQLNPGEVKEATFTFTVKKPEFDLELGILDETFREGLIDKIHFPQKTATMGTFDEPPYITISNPPLSTMSQEVTLNGSVRDKEGVTLVSVFVGDDKVALLPSDSKEVPLSAKVKLNKGTNLITILAKDKGGLVSRESIVVRREG
jgi:carboxyl-terminal processing protease